MDFDIPTDLITKSQIGFRESAGLSSFHRNDTSPPSISTVESSIAALDPSPPYLRCKSCQGKLLRGLQSLICVYCGEYQKKDLLPEPISFSSTIGYSWLLQSLNFNGSERVGSLAEGSRLDGGQRPAEDELTLSELLDLKISWREPEKPENNINIGTSEHNSSLNLGTTDFDNFFTKSMSKSAIVPDILEEQPVASNSDQNKIFEGQANVTSDWNAEFQFADTKVESAKPESVDLFGGTEADLSAHMDVAFRQTESFSFKKPDNASDIKVESAKPEAVDLFSGAEADLSAHMDMAFGQAKSFDFKKPDNASDTKVESAKPESVDLFAGAEADLSAHMDVAFGQTESFDFKKLDNASHPFQDDLFANMSSTTFQQNNQLDSVFQAKDGLSGDPNDSNLKDADGDWFSDGNWQTSSAKNDVSLHDNPNVSSTDWFENADWQKSSTNNTATIKDDNLFDIKPYANDMIPSGKSDIDNSDKHNSDVTDWFQNSQWAIGGSSSTTNIVVSKDDDDDDGFGEWNDFTSSTSNLDSVQDSWNESGTKEDYGISEKMSELDLFQSKVDSQEVDFGNFLQSDIFSGDKNLTDTRAVYDIFSEVPTENRNAANTEAGNHAEGSKNDDFFPNATANPKDDVQMLMSQMHDLSFMLKDELSIPSKPDEIGTFHS